MDVSIIIVNYNTKKLISDCLHSIYEQTKDIEFEVIVSDNGSVDGSVEMLKAEFPQVVLIENNANLGFGAANNRGLAVAKGKYILYLNSDTILLNNAVKCFFDYWENNPEKENIGALGTNLQDENGKILHSGGSFPSYKVEYSNLLHTVYGFTKLFFLAVLFNRPIPLPEIKKTSKKIGCVDYIIGADLFVKNNNLAKFDEDFFMYYEEIYLQYIIAQNNKRRILIDTPQIIHLEGASSKKVNIDIIHKETSFSSIQNKISRIIYFKKTGKNIYEILFLKIFTIILWLNPYIIKKNKKYIKNLIKADNGIKNMKRIFDYKEPFLLKILRKTKIFYTKNGLTDKNCDLIGKDANDFLFNKIKDSKNGVMVCKFGTYELENYCVYHSIENKITLKDFWYAARNIKNYDIKKCFPFLCHNAGFFPNDYSLGYEWYKLVKDDITQIDALCSYQKLEKYIKEELKNCQKISFYGFLTPFLWSNPWTKVLENKNVLVIHPFTDSIKKQYEENREKIFANKDVLPKFKNLYLIKAVQSIAETKTEYNNWFEALKNMEQQIDKIDFDVALIGCGAYGMNLAAYCKRKGKVALHMASYVQLLFGIYGSRWENDSIINKYINEHWVKPDKDETPQNFQSIENGCYW